MVIGTAERSGRERGFTLIATAVCLIALVGMLGLAVDLGRLYIAKSEAQAFADAAALAAVKELDGKSSGITAAKAAVSNMFTINKWQMGSQAFSASNTTVTFSAAANGPWSANPAPGGVAYAKVTATPNLNLTFIRAVGGPSAKSVNVRSTAGILEATFPKGGYLPYRVVAHQTQGDVNFGLQLGEEYTIRWPGNAKVGGNTCHGDNAQQWIDAAGAGGSSERGYFELQSASSIRAAILGQRQLVPLVVGDRLTMSNGNKQTELNAMETLAARDTDLTAYNRNGSNTVPGYAGNGTRIVILPITSSATGDPTATPPILGDQVLTFGAFLLPMTFDNGGNKSWCAIYMGAKVTGGSGVAPYPVAGAYVAKLVQ
jgi:Flp pilus assembly protein TadG